MVASLLAALKDEDSNVRSAAASALRALKLNTPEVVAGLLAALKDKDSNVRSAAASALRALPADTLGLVAGLLAALKDENEGVRSAAALMLEALKVATPEMVAGWLAALKDENSWGVRNAAAAALGALKLNTPEVVAGLLAALKDKNSWSVRRTAALALGVLKIATSEMVASLLAALKDEDSNVRSAAAAALRALKSATPEVVAGLLAALKDENSWSVRRTAASALGALPADTPGLVAGLLAALKDKDSNVRSTAVSALGALKVVATPKMVAGLLAALKDKDSNVRKAAASVLRALPADTPGLVASLLGTALKDKNSNVRSAAAEALGALPANTPGLVASLLAALKDEDSNIKSAAASALGALKLATSEMVASLLAALKDEDSNVRSAATSALRVLKPATPEVVAGLLAALKDEDSNVREAAASALRALKSATPEVVAGLLAALEDEDSNVKSAAASALASFPTDTLLKEYFSLSCRDYVTQTQLLTLSEIVRRWVSNGTAVTITQNMVDWRESGRVFTIPIPDTHPDFAKRLAAEVQLSLVALPSLHGFLEEKSAPIFSSQTQLLTSNAGSIGQPHQNDAAVTSVATNLPEIPDKNETKEEKPALSASGIINYQDLKINKEKELGQGSYGVVYEGIWRANKVAIKQLLNKTPTPGAIKEFETEMQTMTKWRSPNVVQFYGYCLSPSYCLVMEYIPKGSLFSVLHSGQSLDWKIRSAIIADMACGLAFLHAENILHRDLKSLNVLLDIHFRAKLTDFGLVKIKTETRALSTKGDNGTGALAWMAPELFCLRPMPTKQSDIYSLGITMWEVAAQQLPYAGAESSLIRDMVKGGGREEIPKDCPLKIASLIRFCWHKEEKERPEARKVVEYLKDEEVDDFEKFSTPTLGK
jgi:HEAT repeat protein